MTVFKNKDIDVNVNEHNIDIGDIGANFYTEDKSTSYIRIRIKNNNETVNLTNTNMLPKLDLFLNDGSIFMDEDVKIILPEQGLIQYKISDKVIKHPGVVNAKLFLKNQSQSVHVANFKFFIKDSGIADAVEKEITVNIVDDSVRRIIQSNAIELLGQEFEQRLNDDVITHLESKPELFKGPNGDSITVKSKSTNTDGNIILTFSDNTSIEIPKGIDGKNLRFTDLTPSQKLEIKGETGKPLTVKYKYTNYDGNIVLTFSDDTTIEVPKGKDLKFNDLTTSQKQEIKGDSGESITVKSNTINSKGNTLVEFSDESIIEIPKGKDGKDGNDGKDYTQSLYKVDLPLPKPFQGRNLVVIYNQFFVTVRLEGNADGSENNITPNDTTLLQLPANIPRPADTMRGVITSISGNQTTQYTGNLVVNKAGVVTIKFDKNGSNVSTYFGGSLSYPAGALTTVNFNKGFSRKYTFPEPNVLVVQGCDYLDGYIFGAVVKKGDSDIAKTIQVIDTNNSNNSFVAQGDLGVSMGHANGMSVVGKFGNEYLVYVTHMYNPTIIPVYVDVINKTARIGEGVITLQNETGNQIKASSLDYFRYENSSYTFGVFSMGKHYKFIINSTNLDIPRNIKGESMFEIDSVNQIAKDRLILYADLFNQNSTHQSNRFVNGKYLMIQQNWNFSSVIEYEVQIESKSLKRTGRYWSAYKSNKKRFEIESIFEIDGVLHGNVSEENFDGTGYDNYIISFDLHENE